MFRWGYFNETGRLLLNAVAEAGGEARRRDLLALDLMAPGTLDAALRRLVDQGVMLKPRHGTYQIDPSIDLDYLDELAEFTGAAEAADRLENRIRGDRKKYGRRRLARLPIPAAALHEYLGWEVLDSYRVADPANGEILTHEQIVERHNTGAADLPVPPSPQPTRSVPVSAQ
jgi:hypothetical protein